MFTFATYVAAFFAGMAANRYHAKLLPLAKAAIAGLKALVSNK
jgi:hypothetical protein